MICCSRAASAAKPPAVVEHRLREQAERSPLIDDLLASVSHLVSRAARHVGFALAGNPVAVLQRLEFVALGGSRVLVVVVSRGGQVTQKVVDAGEDVRPDDLVQAANYLNTEFAGLPLLEVREAVLARLEQERTLYDELLARALRLARSTLEELPKHHAFHVEGAASLLASAGAGRRLGRHASRARRDDGREGAPGPPAQPVHRGPGADDCDRRGTCGARTCGRSA